MISVFAWLFIDWSGETDKMEESVASISEVMEKKIEYIYGIPSDSFEVVKGVIGRNQMLGNILNSYGVTNRQIFDISNLPKEAFNERKIKAGNKYALFLEKDSAQNVAYFVYEKATQLGLKGFVKNQMNGTVLTVIEGSKSNIQILFDRLKVGPMHSDVRDIKIAWRAFAAEFSIFEIRRY